MDHPKYISRREEIRAVIKENPSLGRSDLLTKVVDSCVQASDDIADITRVIFTEIYQHFQRDSDVEQLAEMGQLIKATPAKGFTCNPASSEENLKPPETRLHEAKANPIELQTKSVEVQMNPNQDKLASPEGQLGPTGGHLQLDVTQGKLYPPEGQLDPPDGLLDPHQGQLSPHQGKLYPPDGQLDPLEPQLDFPEGKVNMKAEVQEAHVGTRVRRSESNLGHTQISPEPFNEPQEELIQRKMTPPEDFRGVGSITSSSHYKNPLPKLCPGMEIINLRITEVTATGCIWFQFQNEYMDLLENMQPSDLPADTRMQPNKDEWGNSVDSVLNNLRQNLLKDDNMFAIRLGDKFRRVKIVRGLLLSEAEFRAVTAKDLQTFRAHPMRRLEHFEQVVVEHIDFGVRQVVSVGELIPMTIFPLQFQALPAQCFQGVLRNKDDFGGNMILSEDDINSLKQNNMGVKVQIFYVDEITIPIVQVFRTKSTSESSDYENSDGTEVLKKPQRTKILKTSGRKSRPYMSCLFRNSEEEEEDHLSFLSFKPPWRF